MFPLNWMQFESNTALFPLKIELLMNSFMFFPKALTQAPPIFMSAKPYIGRRLFFENKELSMNNSPLSLEMKIADPISSFEE